LQNIQKPKELDPIVFVVDPPWGNGFNHDVGLDIAKTEPPVKDIMKKIKKKFGEKRVFFLVKLHEKTYQPSVDELKSSFELFRDLKSGV